MKVYKAKMKGNESKKRPKRKEMKAQKAKMKGKEMKAQQNQNERKSNPKRQILEKEKLQNLKGKWQFWVRS